jgi:hypothetical protein
VRFSPGTCSFAGWERLPDGSRWGVVPVVQRISTELDGKQPDRTYDSGQNIPLTITSDIDEQLDRGDFRIAQRSRSSGSWVRFSRKRTQIYPHQFLLMAEKTYKILDGIPLVGYLYFFTLKVNQTPKNNYME